MSDLEASVPNDISRRKGTIVINRELLLQYAREYDDTNPIFKDFVPVDVKYEFMSNEVSIIGYSPRFRVVTDGEIIPKYEVRIHRNIRVENVIETSFHEVGV